LNAFHKLLGNRKARSLSYACTVQHAAVRHTIWIEMAKAKDHIFEVACPDCGAMLRIDAASGLVVSHTSAPRKRMFEDLETAAQAMRAQEERKESLFRQSVDAEKNKADLMEKKFAEALRKAKDAPEGKPLREFDLD
jgi:uncharacterized Zn-finger protein